jgi:class 3 adenylate cyclase
MICSNCQTVNPENAKFCSECGTKLVAVCPNCGHENAPGAKFCNNCGHKLSAGSKPPGVSQKSSGLERFIPQELAAKLDAARSSRAMEGERRVVTMLFCDVKGSTKAAEQLDPEEWTEIMSGAFEYMIQPIYQFEGMVARLMGDAVLAFFGAPIAHEDDPQRAVLAGLGIVEGIKEYRKDVKLNWGIEFDVRVGINTGLVVVGAVGSDLRMEYTAMGDAINLAARMEQTAVAGTVQIAEDTFSLVAPVFDVEELGGIEVKGKSEPVQTYQVLGRKGTPGRSRGIEGLESPLIGRDQEFGKMKTALEGLHRGVGGILCLIGEAGLGKSRIIRELKTAAEGQGSNFLWHETTSLSYETNPTASFGGSSGG